MFGLFKKKSPIDKLQEEYKKLLAEAHRLSTINRTESDKIAQQADEVLKKIEALRG